MKTVKEILQENLQHRKDDPNNRTVKKLFNELHHYLCLEQIQKREQEAMTAIIRTTWMVININQWEASHILGRLLLYKPEHELQQKAARILYIGAFNEGIKKPKTSRENLDKVLDTALEIMDIKTTCKKALQQIEEDLKTTTPEILRNIDE